VSLVPSGSNTRIMPSEGAYRRIEIELGQTPYRIVRLDGGASIATSPNLILRTF